MSKTILANLVRFVVLVFIQVLLLKNANYFDLSTPFLYILFLLLLPFETPNWLLFVLAFLTGISIDAFYDTAGVNAAACTVLALVRIVFINLTVEKQNFDTEAEPKLGIMGFRWFFFYTVTLTLFHHFTLLLFEAFSFSDLGYVLIRFLLSSVFTIFLVLIAEFMFFRKKHR